MSARARTRWERQSVVWAHDLRLITLCCGVPAGELNLVIKGRRNRPYYRLKCFSCTSWLQTTRLGIRIPVGWSDLCREDPEVDVFETMLSFKREGQKVWDALTWHKRKRKGDTLQDEAADFVRCALCAGDRVLLRIDKTDRPYTICNACGSLAFYNRDAGAHLASLGVGWFSEEQVEEWLIMADRGAAYLERMHTHTQSAEEESPVGRATTAMPGESHE